MKNSTMLKCAFLLAGVLLSGASCIRFTSTAGDGGVFMSKNSGGTWEQKVFVRQEKKKTITIAGGDVAVMLFDPQNPLILYMGSEQSGIYKTENSGDVWKTLLPYNGRTNAFAVNPKNTNVLFAALDARVFRTTDGGGKWEVSYIETRPNVSIADLAIDFFDPKKVYIALSNGDLMRSADGGGSWTILYHVDYPILRVLIHPKDTRVITLLTKNGGLYRTTNLGKDWTALRSTLEKYNNSLYGQALVLDPRTPDALLYFSSFGLLYTKNGAKSWEVIKLLASPAVTPVTAAAIAPQKPEYIYYTTPTTLYRSYDNGKTWMTTPLPTTKRPSVILVHPKDSTIIYLGVTKPKK